MNNFDSLIRKKLKKTEKDVWSEEEISSFITGLFDLYTNKGSTYSLFFCCMTVGLKNHLKHIHKDSGLSLAELFKDFMRVEPNTKIKSYDEKSVLIYLKK